MSTIRRGLVVGSVNDTVIRWLSSSELKGVTGVVLTANWRNSQTLLHAAADPADRAVKLGEAVGRTLTALRALGLRASRSARCRRCPMQRRNRLPRRARGRRQPLQRDPQHDRGRAA